MGGINEAAPAQSQENVGNRLYRAVLCHSAETELIGMAILVTVSPHMVGIER